MQWPLGCALGVREEESKAPLHFPLPHCRLYDIMGGFAHTGGNNFTTLVFVYVLTNVWCVHSALMAAVTQHAKVQ